MPRRFVGFALMIAMAVPNIPVFAASPAAAPAAATGQILGTAANAEGQKMANMLLLARDVKTGLRAGTTISDGSGRFTFAGLKPGTYIVELVNGAGKLVGTSGAIALTPEAMVVTDLAVVGTGLTAAAEGGGSFFTSTLGIVTMAAAGASVAGVVVSTNRTDASPSR